MTLTQGHGCGIDKQKFACLRDKVRTAHRITTKHGTCIALVSVITGTWSDFGEVLLETFILANFLKKFRVFSRSNYFGHISGMVGPIDVKQKGSASVGYWAQYVTLAFDLTHDLDLGCFKVKFRNSSFSGIVGLINVKWKRSELIWYWADCMTLPFDHTHDLDLGVEISMSESERALSQEWDGRLTWNEKGVSYRNWYQDWGHCGVTNDLGSSPQPEGEALANKTASGISHYGKHDHRPLSQQFP